MAGQSQGDARAAGAAGKNRCKRRAPTILVLLSFLLYTLPGRAPREGPTPVEAVAENAVARQNRTATPTALAKETPPAGGSGEGRQKKGDHGRPAKTVDAVEGIVNGDEPGGEPRSACSVESERVITARVETLKAETEAAVDEVHRTEEKNREMFGRLKAKMHAMDGRLDELGETQARLEERLHNSVAVLAQAREEQAKQFTADVQAYIAELGLEKAVFRQREIAVKLQNLSESNEKNIQALAALLQRLDGGKDKAKEWISTVLGDLEKSVEARTLATLERLQRDAQEHTKLMQQQLNDMKLDHLLLVQAVNGAESQLNDRGIAGVDLSQLAEGASFETMRMTFQTVLEEKFKGENLLPIFVVTQCPDSMENVTFMNTYMLPSRRNFHVLLQALGHTPGASAVVIRIESVMVEAWIEVDGKATASQYLAPAANERLSVSTRNRFGFEFVKRVRELGAEDLTADLRGRKVVVAFVGKRKGSIVGLPVTDVTEFNKFQALRTLATLHLSPIKETNNLWQTMKTEVELVATFAATPRIEVGEVSLRIHQGFAPMPKLPPSPFCRNAFTFIRVEVARSPRRKQEYIYPKALLLKKVFKLLVSNDNAKTSGGDGRFAIIRAKASNAGWLQSKLYASTDRITVEIHRPASVTTPGKFSREDVAVGRSSPTLAAVVDKIRKSMVEVVLPSIGPEDGTAHKHVLVHICEIGVTCNESGRGMRA
uniref:Transmembrane protein n=1 Tax=Neospora caninum (strain Liverpool) TaxID=572307 RepID=A0A0F7UH08_NEOCL|nr:TPA: hypothetical protein BN1204_049090 [Neospora caninum Liverpool]